MLTERQREIVKATVPLLETGGEALITHFYQTMLGEYPEVRPLFNQAHQQSGAQPRALAGGGHGQAGQIQRRGRRGLRDERPDDRPRPGPPCGPGRS